MPFCNAKERRQASIWPASFLAEIITLAVGLAMEGYDSAESAAHPEIDGGYGMVSINMAMTMDGKIAPASRGPVQLGSKFDLQRMAEIRAEHDAVFNGATTFRAHPFPLSVKSKALVAERLRKGKSAQPASGVVSSRLDIPVGTAWEKAQEIERWIFCGKGAEQKKITRLEDRGIVVVQSRALRPSPKEIIRAFSRAGKKALLLEGGGELNASFLEEDLVDVIHLTLVPKLLGGADAPTWCEGKGLKLRRYRLAEVKQVGEELYLTYAR